MFFLYLLPLVASKNASMFDIEETKALSEISAYLKDRLLSRPVVDWQIIRKTYIRSLRNDGTIYNLIIKKSTISSASKFSKDFAELVRNETVQSCARFLVTDFAKCGNLTVIKNFVAFVQEQSVIFRSFYHSCFNRIRSHLKRSSVSGDKEAIPLLNKISGKLRKQAQALLIYHRYDGSQRYTVSAGVRLTGEEAAWYTSPGYLYLAQIRTSSLFTLMQEAKNSLDPISHFSKANILMIEADIVKDQYWAVKELAITRRIKEAAEKHYDAQNELGKIYREVLSGSPVTNGKNLVKWLAKIRYANEETYNKLIPNLRVLLKETFESDPYYAAAFYAAAMYYSTKYLPFNEAKKLVIHLWK